MISLVTWAALDHPIHDTNDLMIVTIGPSTTAQTLWPWLTLFVMKRNKHTHKRLLAVITPCAHAPSVNQ